MLNANAYRVFGISTALLLRRGQHVIEWMYSDHPGAPQRKIRTSGHNWTHESHFEVGPGLLDVLEILSEKPEVFRKLPEVDRKSMLE